MRLFHIHVATHDAPDVCRTWLIVARSDRDALRYVPRRSSALTVVSGIEDAGEARDAQRRGVIGWMAGRSAAVRDDAAAAGGAPRRPL